MHYHQRFQQNYFQLDFISEKYLLKFLKISKLVVVVERSVLHSTFTTDLDISKLRYKLNKMLKQKMNNLKNFVNVYIYH